MVIASVYAWRTDMTGEYAVAERLAGKVALISGGARGTVSYTHLTLPTTPYV